MQLWAATAPWYLDLLRFSSGNFVGTLTDPGGGVSRPRTRQLNKSRQGLRVVPEIVACSMADLVRLVPQARDVFDGAKSYSPPMCSPGSATDRFIIASRDWFTLASP